MPGKKLTARKRAELKQKKVKQQKKKGNFLPIVVLAIIFIAVIAGVYYIVTNNESNQNGNGQTTDVAPTAHEDYFIVPVNSYFYRITPLQNDVDKEGDDLNIASVTTPSYGTSEIVADDLIIYIPEENYTGTDSFEYTVTDGEKQSTATVNIFISNQYPLAIINTSKGTIIAELYIQEAPITAGNFIDLANSGYYNGTIFHRVIHDFMIQGGDPTGTGYDGHAAEYHEGYGDPDNPDTWVIPDEFSENLKHDKAGILSMANSGANTGGSQFFITVAPTDWLDGLHAVFGKVIYGLNVAVEISELDPDFTDSNNRPDEDVVVNYISVPNVFKDVIEG
jgi:cyclophilin family peptidyl-prolyl cis-trans isomerase